MDISSKQLTHPLLRPILEDLSGYFSDKGITFFVIGATARDIIMELNDERSGRLTYDLDIAITVNDWEQWQQIEDEIVNLENFAKDPSQKQRFIYKDNFQLDIVPFGNIMKQNNKIFWPPDESFAMSVLGFEAVSQEVINTSIDRELEIKIASLASIFLLKLIAWKDRHHRDNRDAEDMGFILQNYREINAQRAAENYYNEVYDNETIVTGGAALLGIDIAQILAKYPEDLIAVRAILDETLEKRERSKLINQLLETNKTLGYDEIEKCLENLINHLQ